LDRAREGAVDLRVGRAAGVAGEAHADDRRAARAVAASADRALDAVHRAHDVGAAGGLRSAARAATAAARRRLSTRAASPLERAREQRVDVVAASAAAAAAAAAA